MALENLTGPNVFITNLVASNPTPTDPLEQGDDHDRGVKNVLLNSFPNITAAMTLTAAQINALPVQVATIPTGADTLPPKNDSSNGAVGSSPQFAREDHIHPAAGLGYAGQAVWSVTRDAAVHYTNSTGQPILLYVHGMLSVSYSYIVIEVAGVTISGTATASSSYASHQAVIPPGATYRWFPSSGTMSNIQCRELRLGAG